MVKRRAKKRTRTRRAARSAGGIGLQVVAGGVAALGIQAVAERVDTVRDTWYAGPAIIGALGFILRKRQKYAAVGPALLGVAGYSLVQQYQLHKASETAGLMPEYGYDAGALMDPSEQELLTSNRITSAAAPNVALDPAEAVAVADASEARDIGTFG